MIEVPIQEEAEPLEAPEAVEPEPVEAEPIEPETVEPEPVEPEPKKHAKKGSAGNLGKDPVRPYKPSFLEPSGSPGSLVGHSLPNVGVLCINVTRLLC